MSGPSMTWLRLYTDFVYSRKVAALPEKMQARLVKLWCLHQAGHLLGASPADLAYELRLPEREIVATLRVLAEAGFLDADGLPHNWNQRQFASDNITARTRAHRERSRERSEDCSQEQVAERSGEHPGNVRGNGQNRTEQSRTEQSMHVALESAPRARSSGSRKKQDAAVPEEAARLASLLADLIRARDPKAKINPARWASDLEKLHRLDGRDWIEIERVIRWCQADSFEQGNVLSGAKLRERFTALRAKAARATGNRPPVADLPDANEVIAAMDREGRYV